MCYSRVLVEARVFKLEPLLVVLGLDPRIVATVLFVAAGCEVKTLLLSLLGLDVNTPGAASTLDRFHIGGKPG